MGQFSVRLSPLTSEALERRAREAGAARNALVERYVAEGVKMDEHPGIVFRDGALGRRAMLGGTRLAVWQVVETVRGAGGSAEDAAEYLAQPLWQVETALMYYAANREEIDDLTEREHAVSERAEAAWRAGRELFA